MKELFGPFMEYFLQYGTWGLFFISFVESSFFPIPPDFLLIPLALASPANALWYGLICTVGSVLGGLFGYYIGMLGGRPILLKIASPRRMEQVENLYTRYGGWAVFIAGFSPIPYKVFTIASGICRIRKDVFLVASLLGRGLRFMLEALIIAMYGNLALQLIDKYFELLTVVLTFAVVIAVVVYKKFFKVRYASADES